MADQDNMQIKIGAKAEETVSCAQCQGQFSAQQCYTFKGKKGGSVYLCETCRAAAEKAFQDETLNPNMGMAIFLAAVAAIVTGMLWYFISVLTGYQIGYAAIGVGFVIGYAVMWGAGRKRGQVLQIISAVTTVVTLLVSQYFIVLFYVRKYLLEHKAEAPGYDGSFFLVSPFQPEVLQMMFSPIGLLIWGVGIYFAYSLPKPRSI